FCQEESAGAALAEILPRLAVCDRTGAVLALELYPDARPLAAYLAAYDPRRFPHGALRALGRALGTVHRAFRRPGPGDHPRLGWLDDQIPWVMLVHKPGPELLATISL